MDTMNNTEQTPIPQQESQSASWAPPADAQPAAAPSELPQRPVSRLVRGPRAMSSSGSAPAPAPRSPETPTFYQPPAAPEVPVQQPEPVRTPAPAPVQVAPAAPVIPPATPAPPAPPARPAAPAAPVRPRTTYAPPPPPPPAKPAAAEKKGGFWKGFLCVVLILLLVGSSCFATAYLINRHWEDKNRIQNKDFLAQIDALTSRLDEKDREEAEVTAPSDETENNPDSGLLTPAQVYAQNVQAVVAITSTGETTHWGQTVTTTSTGSGFIITEDGYVVTNYHVVEDSITITVTTNAGQTYPATYVGGDENNDLAVLKVDTTGLPTVVIGSSDALIVGDQVVAIGNPLGELTNTLTVGYVSAKDRAVTTSGFAINMIQTDAAINSGNSGGPLFNMHGEVVGITSAKYSGESSSGATIEGIGFAIPIDDVMGLINDLVINGEIRYGFLGVQVSDFIPDYASYYQISNQTPSGAIIREIMTGYCAEAAGLQVNDVIVSVGDYAVSGVTSLSRALRNYGAGDTTTVTVYRDGQELVLEITLDERPEDSAEATEAP